MRSPRGTREVTEAIEGGVVLMPEDYMLRRSRNLTKRGRAYLAVAKQSRQNDRSFPIHLDVQPHLPHPI